MDSKSISLKWDQLNFSNFVLEALIKLGLTSKKTKKLNLNLDLNKYSRYFIYKEFQIEINPGDNEFYEFIATPLPNSYEIRFGCELETCFVLNCKSQKYNDFIEEKIIEIRDNKDYEKKKEQWKDLILFHIKTNLTPYFTKEFLKRFPYAYIMSYHAKNAVYIDLATGEEIFKNKEVDDYKTLQFAQDASVECGDTDKDDNTLSVHCEIISPILKDISDIKLIYENIISEDCNSSNSSSGYHVNVSLVDPETKDFKQIKLTPGFLYEICKRWYSFEKKHYNEYRGQGSFYAANISKNSDDVELMQILYEYQENITDKISKKQVAGSEKVEMNHISKDEIFSPENKPGLRNLFYMNQINNKLRSLHSKIANRNILEFRVFPSKNEMNLLIDYTRKSINLIKNSTKYFLENPDKVVNEYNSLVSRYKESKYFNITLKDLYNYKGSFKNFDKLFKFKLDIYALDFFSDFTTTLDIEEEQETTFLFFFKQKNIIKRKQIIKGIIEGYHNYILPRNNLKLFVNINYIPEEDFIELSDYKIEYILALNKEF